jgi:hypothetical protein
VKIRVVHKRLTPAEIAEKRYGRSYTYWTDEIAFVGDVVEVPPNWLFSSPQTATVVAVGSTYDGEMATIRRIVARAEDPGSYADDDEEDDDAEPVA